LPIRQPPVTLTDVTDLNTPRTILLTGATSGIGKALARRLAVECHSLILQGPEPTNRVQSLLAELRASGTAVAYVQIDYCNLAEVSAGAELIKAAGKIDVVVNNAAIPGPQAFHQTTDGTEATLQVNAIAPAFLTQCLLRHLQPGVRIVNVGSAAHHFAELDLADLEFRTGYSSTAAYGRSKLALVAWSLWLARSLAGTGIDVITVCPGVTDTPLSAAMMGRIGASPVRGAGRVYRAISADVPTGTYLESDRPAPSSADALDARFQAKVVEMIRGSWPAVARPPHEA